VHEYSSARCEPDCLRLSEKCVYVCLIYILIFFLYRSSSSLTVMRSWIRVFICACCFGSQPKTHCFRKGGRQLHHSTTIAKTLPKPKLYILNPTKTLNLYAGDELRGCEHPEKITCTCVQRSSSSSSTRPLNVPHIRDGHDRSVDTQTQTQRHRDRDIEGTEGAEGGAGARG
jgi:hypothetical protein